MAPDNYCTLTWTIHESWKDWRRPSRKSNNATITQSVVTNLTRHDSLFRLEVKVGVSYDSDVDLVRETLETTLNGLEWRSTEHEPAVYPTEFGDSSVNYVVYAWIDNVRRTLKPALDDLDLPVLADRRGNSVDGGGKGSAGHGRDYITVG